MAGLHWSVTVECDGKHVVTIAHNHLSGDPEPNEEAIRTAANHLLAFIGDPHETVFKPLITSLNPNANGADAGCLATIKVMAK